MNIRVVGRGARRSRSAVAALETAARHLVAALAEAPAGPWRVAVQQGNQAGTTRGPRPSLPALRTEALSKVMNASSPAPRARCSASAKSMPRA